MILHNILCIFYSSIIQQLYNDSLKLMLSQNIVNVSCSIYLFLFIYIKNIEKFKKKTTLKQAKIILPNIQNIVTLLSRKGTTNPRRNLCKL